MRNPTWTREEMILAADLASKIGWRGVNSKNPEIIKLSELLRCANFHPEAKNNPDFRSANSVSMKINNLVAGHPSSKGVGLRSTAAERAIIEEFIQSPSTMALVAKNISQAIRSL